MKFVIKNDKAEVYAPYNPEFVKRIKNIGKSKWNGKAWVVDVEFINAIREIMADVYGETDLSINKNRVNVRVKFKKDIIETKAAVTLFGKTIAIAFGRDSGATPGEDVAILSGEIKSGGSSANWQSIICAGTEIFIKNVNEDLLKQDDRYEIMIEEPIINKDALLNEREELVERIREIDNMLSQMA